MHACDTLTLLAALRVRSQPCYEVRVVEPCCIRTDTNKNLMSAQNEAHAKCRVWILRIRLHVLNILGVLLECPAEECFCSP